MASTTTTNYALTKPGTKDTGWGAAVDTNFDVIDTTMKANADAIALKATDTLVVKLAGTQTVTGDKDFTGALTKGGVAVVLSNSVTPSNATVTDAKIAAGGLTTAALSATAGILKTQLAAAVQTSLGKADTAFQATAPAVTGSKASGAALTSLLSVLAAAGLITDSTSA